MMEKMNPVVTALRDDIRRRQQVVQHIASLEEQLDSDRICGAWLAAQGTLTASLRRIGTATYRMLVYDHMLCYRRLVQDAVVTLRRHRLLFGEEEDCGANRVEYDSATDRLTLGNTRRIAMERRLALLLVWLLLGAGAARAQWVVSDPSNLAQGIVNSTNEMVHTSSTAQSMLQNFQQTVKIYEQNKKYYDALRKVNKLVRDARKVQRCMLLVGEISDIYVDGYRRIVTDTNFSVEELAAIAIGYKRIIEEAAGELKDLGEIINPTDMSLTDKDRIDVVERVYGTLMRHRRLAGYFTRRCISVSLLRARTHRDMERVVALYGTDEQRYW